MSNTSSIAADCNDPTFRLSIYEAGHSITAYLLSQKIVSIQMLPRPPITVTEKTFSAFSWDSFIDTLENRVLELFGGQIAEQIICQGTSCCSGDISRIDEISRILEALYAEDEVDSEDILFDLEERAIEMFSSDVVRDAILPIAQFLYDQEEAGHIEINGKDVTKLIATLIPRPPADKPSILQRLHLA